MRTLLIVLLVVLALAVFGPTLLTWLVSGLFAILVPLFVVLLLAGIGFFVGAVLLGSTLLGLTIVAGVVLFVGFSLFWPVLLVFAAIWLFTTTRTQAA
ncbi:hypothetical protein FM042_11070 [Aliidiomarina halalkaliphila]|uniref:Uncharacterized protein n=1 Tax=Aliidiomarina halalkaliphila TaxID=2593535 RepID=A0A552WZE2_9GAMM|nr:hypothetical protein [Aliidiomarina halalkaliphila]TRW48188.1 hypothetical protein FM042_11070 [Aliidiomarina halalkaliphila]